jgi:hypothetical protein
LKKRLTIGVIVTALAATMSFVAAGPYARERAAAAALPPEEIVAAVQSLGLVPTTRALRRGHYYVLHALDRRGTELRVVADAELGDIVAVTPIYIPRYDAGPRIIHVPQPGERSERANDSDESALPDNEIIEQAPPPRHRAAPRHPRVRHKAAPPPRPRRSMLSVPPPAQGPSPASEPKSQAKSETKSGASNQAKDLNNDAEKFRAPDEHADRTRLPPPGYAPSQPAQDESVNSDFAHSRASGNPAQQSESR